MAAALVADASVAAAWCFPDEQTDYTLAVLKLVAVGSLEVLVPHLWAYEIRNCVLMGVRRKRITRMHGEQFLDSLRDLPVRLVEPASYNDVFRLADESGLTFYDTAYLELAIQYGIPLATLDRELQKAAAISGVKLFHE